MNKSIKQVPAGVRYISDWKEYKLEDYAFPHILNKVLTGCGFTEYCLRNQQNIILVSPRKFLLENKEDQHKDDVLYVKNEIKPTVDYEANVAEFNKEKPAKIIIPKEDILLSIQKMKEDIRNYCHKRLSEGKPKKILVTYDSFRHVKETLLDLGIFQNYQVVVDEFQSIFIDSHFKSDTEMELLHHLQDVQKLCFVSATPMLDKYLDMLDEFKDLPYLEFDWETKDPSRIVKPILEIKFTKRSLNEEAGQVIKNYLKGNFESRLNTSTGGFIESREATLFMNSVKNICQVIRSNRLHIDQCNVLCARTVDNEFTVRKAFNDVLKKEHPDDKVPPKVPKDYEVIGRIPKKGDPHKMFTFCTRTVYLGADFYSTNSRTFIFSDSNIECLSVDISMDLEQILGRQRLDINPWKNTANLYVKTLSDTNIISKEEFENFLNKKIKSTNDLLETYGIASDSAKHVVAEKYEFSAKHEYYKKDYVAVNHHSGSDLKPVFNNLVLVSEIRTFEVQQIDYKDRFSVFNTLLEKGIVEENKEVDSAIDKFIEIGNTTDKLKFLVKYTTETPGITEKMINYFLSQIPMKYSDYYHLLGPDRIKANSYQESKLKLEWIKRNSETTIDNALVNKIYETFIVGERYTNKDIKSKLTEIYRNFGHLEKAKASDLDLYFVKKKVYITSLKENGFEILGKR